MTTIIILILVLGLLILAHEFGHFIAAKKSGLIVEEFGIGFPPRIFSVKRQETVYSVNLLPLGGFVKILGEDGSDYDNPKSFSSKSVGTRSLIAVAGVFMNFLLAMALLIIGFSVGLPQPIDESNAGLAKNIKIQIIAVADNSPAKSAGIKMGDSIKDFSDISEFQETINANKGAKITLFVQRGEQVFDVQVTPRINPPDGEGALGVALAKTGTISYPFHQSVWLGIKSSFAVTWEIIKGFTDLLKNLFVSGKVPQDVAGPVGIAVLTDQAFSLGYIYLLQLVAFISLNLTVLNLLPFPALDGGRLLFLGIEKIKGSKVSPKIENTAHSFGLLLILILFVLLTYRDILRLI